jgi:hypothetical protein
MSLRRLLLYVGAYAPTYLYLLPCFLRLVLALLSLPFLYLLSCFLCLVFIVFNVLLYFRAYGVLPSPPSLDVVPDN